MNRIKELRKKQHMSQIRLSIELEVSQETISAYEQEKYYPSFQTLVKLSDIFGTSIDYLMGLTDVETPSLSADNPTVVEIFNQLNYTQKEKALSYMEGLRDS